jgi:hypothetical protein
MVDIDCLWRLERRTIIHVPIEIRRTAASELRLAR